MRTGIPQGSPLSSILYQFYNADLLEICDRPGTNTSAIEFVDDANIWHTEKAPKRIARLWSQYIDNAKSGLPDTDLYSIRRSTNSFYAAEWVGLGWVIKIRTQPNRFWVGLGYCWVTQQKRVLIYGHPIRYLDSPSPAT